jgi:hypothetical protein
MGAQLYKTSSLMFSIISELNILSRTGYNYFYKYFPIDSR